MSDAPVHPDTSTGSSTPTVTDAATDTPATEPPTDADLADMLDRATDGCRYEWGWYEDHVPVLIREIRRLRAELAARDT